MVLFASLISSGMLLVGIALLSIILLRRWHRYYGPRRRSKKQSAGLVRTGRQVAKADRSLSDAPNDVLRWQVEMHETARDLKGELDSKMIALQLLVRSAREQAERLEQLLAHIEESRKGQVTDRQCGPPVEGKAAMKNEPSSNGWPGHQAEIYALADEGRSPTTIARILGAPLGDVELILSLRGS